MRIATKSITKLAAECGYVIQVNQHAPDGYDGAFSADVLSADSGHVAVSRRIGNTRQSAQRRLRKLVLNLCWDGDI